MKNCPKCNNNIPDDSEFCQICGSKLGMISDSEPHVQKEHHKQFEPDVSKNENAKIKNKYCKSCGGLINSFNKKCEQCGKQYFYVPKLRLSNGKAVYALMGLLILGLVGLNIFQYINNQSKISKFDDMIKFKDNQIEAMRTNSAKKDTKIDELNREIQWRKIDFFDSHIVFVMSETGNYYYTYDEIIEKFGYFPYSFWAYNTEAAKSQGYIDGN